MGGSSSREACLRAYVERETQIMVDRHYYRNQVHQTVKILQLVPPIFTAFDENKDTWLQLKEIHTLLTTYIAVLRKYTAKIWKRTLCVKVDKILAHMRKHHPTKYTRIAAAWQEDYQRMLDKFQKLMKEQEKKLNRDPMWLQIIAKEKGELETYQSAYNKQFGAHEEKHDDADAPNATRDKHLVRLQRHKLKKAQMMRANAGAGLMSQRVTSPGGVLSPLRPGPGNSTAFPGARGANLISPTGLRGPSGMMSSKQPSGLMSSMGPRQNRAFTFGNGPISSMRKSSLPVSPLLMRRGSAGPDMSMMRRDSTGVADTPLARRGSSAAETPAFLRRGSAGTSSVAMAAAMLNRRSSGDPASSAAIAAAASLMRRRLSSPDNGARGVGSSGGARSPMSPMGGRKGSVPSALLMSMMAPQVANMLLSQRGSRPTLYMVQQTTEPENPYSNMVPVQEGLLRRWLTLLKAGEPKNTIDYGQVDMARSVSRSAFLEVFRIVLEKTDLSLAGITRKLFNQSRMGPVLGAYYRQAMLGELGFTREERRAQIAADMDRIRAREEERQAAERNRERERARRAAKQEPANTNGSGTPMPGGSPGRLRVGSAGVGAGLAKGSLKGGKVISLTENVEGSPVDPANNVARSGTPAATRSAGRSPVPNAYVSSEDDDSDEDLVALSAKERNRRMRARNKGRKSMNSGSFSESASGDFTASADAGDETEYVHMSSRFLAYISLLNGLI